MCPGHSTHPSTRTVPLDAPSPSTRKLLAASGAARTPFCLCPTLPTALLFHAPTTCALSFVYARNAAP
eukprot:2604742-Prorocentrum_lima.AAC.1